VIGCAQEAHSRPSGKERGGVASEGQESRFPPFVGLSGNEVIVYGDAILVEFRTGRALCIIEEQFLAAEQQLVVLLADTIDASSMVFIVSGDVLLAAGGNAFNVF